MTSKLFATLMTLTLAIGWCSMVSAQEFVTDGLIAMWTLDAADIDGDTVKDMSGNGNDATIMGTLESVEGVIDECLQFDGGENFIEIPAMGSFDQVSVECWAYEADWAPNMQGILSTWQWEAGKVHFKFQDNAIQVDKNGGSKVQMPGEIETWYHIIYTTDTLGDVLKLYVDGEFIAEGPAGAGQPELWDERRIGSEHDGRFLNGMIDEVRVYDRVLDDGEVAQNFNVTTNTLTSVEAIGKLSMTWGSIKSEK